MSHLRRACGIGLIVGLVAACGGESSVEPQGGKSTTSSATTSGQGGAGQGGGATGTGGASTTTTAGGGAGGASTTSTGAGGGGTTTTTTTTTGSGGAPASAGDPAKDGPFAIAELDQEITVAATGDKVGVHVVYPTVGPAGGPYPVVLIAHGFQLPPSQYTSYAQRLATFGYVAATVDFPNLAELGVLPNHLKSAQDVVGVLDGVAAIPALAGKVDANNVGVTGHSLGGKVSFLGATLEPRVKAAITLDPVDSAMLCDPAKCPDVSDLMGTLSIPVGVLGETTDAAGGLQPCAPAKDNFTTFYASAKGPALSVEVIGANHMSFLDDVSKCGLACSACNAAKADNATVNALSKAYVVAFYERWLRGNAAYDDYLTGATAKARYVDTGLVTIQSK